MAEGKKSFVLYCDLINVVKKLKQKDKAELFDHILEYVNDMNPETKNKTVELVFEPIKLQFKRDLKKWESLKKRNSENGKLGGRPKTQNNPENPNGFSETQNNPLEPKKADTVTVTVTDTVNVTELNKKGPMEFFTLMGSIITMKVSVYMETNHRIFLDSWRINNKEPIYDSVMKELDKSYMGHDFSDENHVRNSFKRKWKEIKENPINPVIQKQTINRSINGKPQ